MVKDYIIAFYFPDGTSFNPRTGIIASMDNAFQSIR